MSRPASPPPSATIDGAPVEHGGTITTLNNGDEFVPALLDSIAMRRARSTSPSNLGRGRRSATAVAALEKKQREGVTVRVLLDGLGSIKVPDEDFEGLVAAGGKVQKFRMPKFGKLTRFHRRNHRRSIVIDGEVGFTGGMAVADIWLGNAQDEDHWRDIMFKVTGPLARSLQAAFVDLWVSSSGELLIDPKKYPVSAPAAIPGSTDSSTWPTHRLTMTSRWLTSSCSRFCRRRESIYLGGSVLHSRQPSAVGARRGRRRAGVDVRLLLPGSRTDNWITRASAQARYQELLEAGAKIYGYQPTFMHAKYSLIDGKWSIIGSPNLKSRSRQLDEENALGIETLRVRRGR